MTTLDRPFFAKVVDSRSPRRGFRGGCTILACAPKYRVLRAIISVHRLRPLRHPGLRRLLTAHWHALRTHSAWSRA